MNEQRYNGKQTKRLSNKRKKGWYLPTYSSTGFTYHETSLGFVQYPREHAHSRREKENETLSNTQESTLTMVEQKNTYNPENETKSKINQPRNNERELLSCGRGQTISEIKPNNRKTNSNN